MAHALQPLGYFDKSVVHEIVQLARFESLVFPESRQYPVESSQIDSV